jgi:hypothetical protein
LLSAAGRYGDIVPALVTPQNGREETGKKKDKPQKAQNRSKQKAQEKQEKNF